MKLFQNSFPGPFLWFIRCILGKFTASFMLNSRKETQSLESAGSKILGLCTLVIEQGLKQRKDCSLIHFFNLVWKFSECDAVNLIMNQFIKKLNLLHVEVYQNEISRRLPTILASVICRSCRFYRDWKLFCELKSEIKKIENSSGIHFFMFEIFDQCRWKLRQESHALASK